MKVRGALVTLLCPLGHVLVLAFLLSHYMVDLTQIRGMIGRPRLHLVLSLKCTIYLHKHQFTAITQAQLLYPCPLFC